MVLELSDFFQIIGSLKNCSAYQSFDKFKQFVDEFEKSYWEYVNVEFNAGKEAEVSMVALFSLKFNLRKYPFSNVKDKVKEKTN